MKNILIFVVAAAFVLVAYAATDSGDVQKDSRCAAQGGCVVMTFDALNEAINEARTRGEKVGRERGQRSCWQLI